MSNRAEHILREALKLPVEERADEAWAAEIERRARRVLAGESSGTDWTEVRARLASSLPKR